MCGSVSVVVVDVAEEKAEGQIRRLGRSGRTKSARLGPESRTVRTRRSAIICASRLPRGYEGGAMAVCEVNRVRADGVGLGVVGGDRSELQEGTS